MMLATMGAAIGQDIAARLFKSSAMSMVQRTVKIFLIPAITTFCTDASRAFPTGEPGEAVRRNISKDVSLRGMLIFIARVIFLAPSDPVLIPATHMPTAWGG
jgi:hypothetical protein